jgi:hypothetical protein
MHPFSSSLDRRQRSCHLVGNGIPRLLHSRDRRVHNKLFTLTQLTADVLSLLQRRISHLLCLRPVRRLQHRQRRSGHFQSHEPYPLLFLRHHLYYLHRLGHPSLDRRLSCGVPRPASSRIPSRRGDSESAGKRRCGARASVDRPEGGLVRECSLDGDAGCARGWKCGGYT